jgi:hypothetical protein
MLKKTVIAFALPLLSLLVISLVTPPWRVSAQPASQTSRSPQQAGSAVATSSGTGTIQKMIVENGSVTMDLDVSRLNGAGFATQNLHAHFAVGANSFFPVLIFNDQLRGPLPGSMALIPAGMYSNLPAALGASFKQLVVEKLPSGQGSDLAVRDSNTGFTFFNIQGHQYDYDAAAQSLVIINGRLVVSKEFAQALGRPSDVDSVVGTISIGAVMQPIQIDQLVNGETRSMVMPPMQNAASPAQFVGGPDVIVGEIEDVDQQGSVGTQVGLAIGTDSCNLGDQGVDWFALPQTDHPLVPQNLYRMSGGATNDERFEQIGQSWMKHTFLALEESVCDTCNTSGCQTGTHLCPGCSDPYVSGLNGDQESIGSRAWVNPFTGVFPSNANDHTGHSHNGVSHRILVNMSDLDTTQNPGASYFGEAAYITPHEYTWCQSHPDQCNMFNNFSYRGFHVTGTTNFTFTPTAPTQRMKAAIEAWVTTGATVNEVEPDPGNDGRLFMGYKVTNPSAGVWHYEYALFNMNLDRSIQSFSVPGGAAANISNIGFHAPPQHPGWPHDGTQGDAGYSSAPWDATTTLNSITWSTETFATNPNANAIRWGTLYNFRFDSDQPPQSADATVGFFKTGSPVTVEIQAPSGGVVTPTPTPTASPTSTPSPTVTPTPSASATPTSTPRPTPTPRPNPPPRVRPTPHPRP